MKVFEKYFNLMAAPIKKQVEEGNNPFKNLKYIKTLKDQKMDFDSQVVILASPGMLQKGYSRDLFEKWRENEKNGVVFTGYAVEGTLAQSIDCFYSK